MGTNLAIEQVFEQMIPVYRAFTSAAQQFVWQIPGLVITAFEMRVGGLTCEFKVSVSAAIFGVSEIIVLVPRRDALEHPNELINELHKAFNKAGEETAEKLKHTRRLMPLYLEVAHGEFRT